MNCRGKTTMCMPVCFDANDHSISDGKAGLEIVHGDAQIENRKDQATEYWAEQLLLNF